MASNHSLDAWGYGLTLAGGILILAATVFSILLVWGLRAGLALDAWALPSHARIEPLQAPWLLFLLWGLITGGLVLASAVKTQPGTRGPRKAWCVIGILAATGSFFVTGGFTMGAMLAIVGASLTLASQTQPDAAG